MSDYLQSWELFWAGWVSAWLIASLLPLFGVVLLARRQVVLGVTVAQSGGLGVVMALWMGAVIAGAPAPEPTPEEAAPGVTQDEPDDPLDAFMAEEGIPHEPEPPAHAHSHSHSHGPQWAQSDAFRLLLAVVFAVAASLIAGGFRGDAVLGWLFLVSSGGAVMLAGFTPHGMQEVQRLLGSTLITATVLDVVVLGTLCALTVLLLAGARRSVLLWATEPAMARALGVPTRLVGAGYFTLGGAVLGASMYASGLTFTFACLVLPLLLARNLARRTSTLLWLAPLSGLAGAAATGVAAHHFDLPPGPLFAVVMGAGVALSAVMPRLRPPC